ncbi:MAG: hypothetical protein HZB18_02290 [Chloroflexi bacterium]|nr:hypothetical protein [Chloroflexota bacterium]
MFNFKNQIRMTMALGVLSILAGIFAHLALTDIYHGEADLSLEWGILQGSAVIIFMFILTSLVTLKRAIKTL